MSVWRHFVERLPGALGLKPGHGFSLGHSASLPTCAANRRGELRRVEGGAGVADRAVLCRKNDGDGYEWVDAPNAEYYFLLTADGSAIGATIADFFGANSSISLPASSSWELEAHLYYTKTTAGTVTYTITNSAANYTNIAARYEQSRAAGIGANAATTGAGITATTTAAAALPATPSLTTGVDHFAIIRATIDMNAAGNIRIRCTESAGTITPRRGSFYKIRRLPASVGTFAA